MAAGRSRDRDGERPAGGQAVHWLLLAVIGVTGLLAEVIGLGMVVAWWRQPPRSLADPRLSVGLVLAVVGLFIVLRGVAIILKRVIRLLAQPDMV